MKYEKESLGTMVVFLLPSVPLKKRSSAGPTVEDRLHDFLLENFKGYTATMANVFGYWINQSGKEFYGEHVEYKVSLLDPTRIPVLEEYLVDLAQEIEEDSIYVASGEKSWLLYPIK